GTAQAGTALVRPEPVQPRRRTSPLLLAGAATIVAGAIVTASALTAGSLADQRTDRVTTLRMTPTFQPSSSGTPAPAPEALGPTPETEPVSTVKSTKPTQRTAPIQRVKQRGGEREAVDPRSKPLRSTPKPAPKKPASKPPA